MPARAEQVVGHFFSQTGHNVIGEFWTYYQSVEDAAVVFGLPITEQFISADGSGLVVQYFEHVRFELHPDLPFGQRVQVSKLGTKLYIAGTPSVNETLSGDCLVINGFGVCYDFLAFFLAHGGVERFGNPISAFEFQPNGQIVQHFERALFEWHPELQGSETVMLADLGRLYFNKVEDPSRLNRAKRIDEGNIPTMEPVSSIRIMASVDKASTRQTDTQKITVVVMNQSNRPVSGATGTVTVNLPDGKILIYPISTDISGIAIVPVVSFSDQPLGMATVTAQVQYNGLRDSVITSFRIWR